MSDQPGTDGDGGRADGDPAVLSSDDDEAETGDRGPGETGVTERFPQFVRVHTRASGGGT